MDAFFRGLRIPCGLEGARMNFVFNALGPNIFANKNECVSALPLASFCRRSSVCCRTLVRFRVEKDAGAAS